MDQPSSTESNAITLRIKFRSASLDDFINRYGVDVSPGGIFIRTKQPVEVGTTLQFEFSLADGSPLLTGTGTVAWVRENDPARPNNVPGMGLRFDKLVPESQHTHQTILAEKAHKEGKAAGSSYPPASSVVPAARPSQDSETVRSEIPKPEPDKAPVVPSVTTTRPAAAALVNPSALPFAVPAQPSRADTIDRRGDAADDEFDGGGKTEISDKPLDFYLKDAAREAEEAQNEAQDAGAKSAGEGVPNKLIEDFNTDAVASPTRSGPPPEGYVQSAGDADDADTEPPSVVPPFADQAAHSTRKSASLAALIDLDHAGDSSREGHATPSEVVPELSAGAPLEETPPERTEEVAMGGAAASPEAQVGTVKFPAPEPFDLGVGSASKESASLDAGSIGVGSLGAASLDDRPLSRDGVPSLQSKRGSKRVVVIGVVAAAVAFAAVYLAKARPWESAPPASAVAPPAVPTVPAPVAPSVPAAEPAAKPAAVAAAPKRAAEEPAKPAAPEAKLAVAEKAASDDKAADKSADKAGEPKGEAKAEAEAKAEPSPKASSKGKASKVAVAEEKAGSERDAVYRLVFRSTPMGAEVLIDGEYYARTPCERRILDSNKVYAITLRKAGYEAHERMLGPSDNWVKKGNERLLTVSVTLKKTGSGGANAGAPAGEADKAASEPKAEAPTEPKAAASQPEPASVPKIEPPKAISPPEEKPSLAKPAPSFDEPAAKKAKE